MTPLDYEIYGIALLPIIIGLVQIIKAFNIPDKFVPVVSIVIGEIICCFFLIDGSVKQAVLMGLQMGLAAVGLHSGVKTMTNGKK